MLVLFHKATEKNSLILELVQNNPQDIVIYRYQTLRSFGWHSCFIFGIYWAHILHCRLIILSFIFLIFLFLSSQVLGVTATSLPVITLFAFEPCCSTFISARIKWPLHSAEDLDINVCPLLCMILADDCSGLWFS